VTETPGIMKQNRDPTLHSNYKPGTKEIKKAREKIGRTVLHAAVVMLNCGPRPGLQESCNHEADGDE
jgi:hypothetical protein